MKKLLIAIIIAIAVPGISYGQSIKKFTKFHIRHVDSGISTAQQDTVDGTTTLGIRLPGKEGALSDSLWTITSTGSDYSRVYRTNPNMTYKITVAGSSPNITLTVYMAGALKSRLPALSEFEEEDTKTITTAGTIYWVFTYAGSDRPNVQYQYIKIVGNSGNGTTTVVIEYHGFDEEAK